jgi:hypothetical protein
MKLERSRQGLQLRFRPRRDLTLQSGVMAVQSSGSLAETISGVSGICAIWMPPPWRAVKNTIGSKVVTYSPSPGRGESCVSKCPWQVPTPKGVPNAKLTSRGWFLDADSSFIF